MKSDKRDIDKAVAWVQKRIMDNLGFNVTVKIEPIENADKSFSRDVHPHLRITVE